MFESVTMMMAHVTGINLDTPLVQKAFLSSVHERLIRCHNTVSGTHRKPFLL